MFTKLIFAALATLAPGPPEVPVDAAPTDDATAAAVDVDVEGLDLIDPIEPTALCEGHFPGSSCQVKCSNGIWYDLGPAVEYGHCGEFGDWWCGAIGRKRVAACWGA